VLKAFFGGLLTNTFNTPNALWRAAGRRGVPRQRRFPAPACALAGIVARPSAAKVAFAARFSL